MCNKADVMRVRTRDTWLALHAGDRRRLDGTVAP